MNSINKKSLKYLKDKFLVILQFFIIALHFIEIKNVNNRITFKEISILDMGGYFLIAVGLILILISVKELGKNISPFPIPRVNSVLITSGIYSKIRHPMYYSLLIISIGFFILSLTIYKLILTISLGIVIFIKIKLEEEYLNNKFKKYKSYINKTKF